MAQYLGQEEDSQESSSDAYPYLVVRYGEKSFQKRPIWFVRRSEKEFLDPKENKLVIAVPDEVEDGEGAAIPRELVIDSARIHMNDQRHAFCVVFNEDDCVYLQHDGSVIASSQLPG